MHGSLSYYTNQPEDSDEGATNRVGFNLSGALIKDVLQFRLYGNWNKTQADEVGINGDPAIAGREGVRNKDINGRLVWNINEKNKLTLDSVSVVKAIFITVIRKIAQQGFTIIKTILKPKRWQEVKLKLLVYIVRTMLYL